MLNNEKYTGDFRLLKSRESEVQYLSSDNNPAIISKERFEAVQIEKKKRSNVIRDENSNQRVAKSIVQRKGYRNVIEQFKKVER